MAKLELNKKGMADLEKRVGKQLKKAEVEANQAAARQSTPAAKAHAFAQVLRKHGVDRVNEAELRKKFGG